MFKKKYKDCTVDDIVNAFNFVYKNKKDTNLDTILVNGTMKSLNDAEKEVKEKYPDMTDFQLHATLQFAFQQAKLQSPTQVLECQINVLAKPIPEVVQSNKVIQLPETLEFETTTQTVTEDYE